MVALAAAVSRSPHTAEDLAQEAMLRARRHWDRLGAFDKPGTWVRRVTINLSLEQSTRRRSGSQDAPRVVGATRTSRATPGARPGPPRRPPRPVPPPASRRLPALPRGPLDTGDRRPPRLLGVHRTSPPPSRPPSARPAPRSHPMSDHDTTSPRDRRRDPRPPAGLRRRGQGARRHRGRPATHASPLAPAHHPPPRHRGLPARGRRLGGRRHGRPPVRRHRPAVGVTHHRMPEHHPTTSHHPRSPDEQQVRSPRRQRGDRHPAARRVRGRRRTPPSAPDHPREGRRHRARRRDAGSAARR